MLSKEVSSTIFKVFGMTWPGIEPPSSGPLTNTQGADPGRPGFNSRSSHTKDSKMVLDTSLFNTQHYKVGIKGKVDQSWESSSALPYTLV